MANFSSNNVSVLLGTGTGSFDPATPFSVGVGPFSVAIGDLNADGKPDLAVANESSYNVSVLLNTTTPFSTFALTVTKGGTGAGTVTSPPAATWSGISCGTACSASFAPGVSLTLTATADAGSVFTGWSGACAGINPCSVTMNANKSVTATFTLQ